MISAREAIILTEDEAEAILRALKVDGLWGPERINELRKIVVGNTNAFEVLDAIKTELRRRNED